MLPLNETLLRWADELEKHKFPDWDALPDIDLYMDQIITYLERQMSIYTQSPEEKPITPAMINNYVKSEVIPRPIQKKYTREHLVYLMAVLNLKQVLSLSDISRLIAYKCSDEPIQALLQEFNSIQQDTFQSASERLKEALLKLDGGPSPEDAEKELAQLALKLSLEANINQIMAKRILDEIALRKSKEKDEKDKERDKSRDKDKPKEK